MKNKKYSVHIKNIFDEFELNIQPLNTQELNELIVLAMKTGFWGNRELIEFIINHGCINNKEAEKVIAKLSIFTISDLAREIWILTLKNLANTSNGLWKLVSNSVQKLTIRRYKYKDLATPGLLYFISGHLTNIDSERYSKAFMTTMLPQVTYKGKLLSKRSSKKFILDNFEGISTWYLSYVGVSDNYIKDLPSEVFASNKEKLYAMMALKDTLDWRQYSLVLTHYNTALSRLTTISNKMGGMNVEENNSVLLTGVASFITLIKTPTTVNKEILFAFLEDVLAHKKQVISPYYTHLIKKYHGETLREIYKEYGKKIENFELAYQIFIRMAKKINNNERLVNIINFRYWDIYKQVFIEDMKEQLKEISQQVDMLLIPDCYVLVEGESDKICYAKFIELSNDNDLRIRVIDCKGKKGVYKKYKDMIKEQNYIGSIVTILDADAKKEHNDIIKIRKGNTITSNHIYDNGSLENLFSKQMIINVLNTLYPGKTKFKTSELIIKTSLHLLQTQACR